MILFYKKEEKSFWQRRMYITFNEVIVVLCLIYINWNFTELVNNNLYTLILLNILLLASRINFFNYYKYYILEFKIDEKDDVYIKYLEYSNKIAEVNCKLSELTLNVNGLYSTLSLKIAVNKKEIFKQNSNFYWKVEELKEIYDKVIELQKSKGIRTW